MRQCFYICSSLCVRLAAGVSPVRHTSKMLSPASWRWAWQSHDRLSVPGSEAVSASISPVLRGDLGSPGSCFQLNGNKDFFFFFFSVSPSLWLLLFFDRWKIALLCFCHKIVFHSLSQEFSTASVSSDTIMTS